MAVVHGATLLDMVRDGGESAKTLNRPGLQRLLKLVDQRQVQAVIVAKLDRLTRSVKDLCDTSGEDDAAQLPSVPVQRSVAVAEPDRLQPGESVAAAVWKHDVHPSTFGSSSFKCQIPRP